jgi:hypothetical protein
MSPPLVVSVSVSVVSLLLLLLLLQQPLLLLLLLLLLLQPKLLLLLLISLLLLLLAPELDALVSSCSGSGDCGVGVACVLVPPVQVDCASARHVVRALFALFCRPLAEWKLKSKYNTDS